MLALPKPLLDFGDVGLVIERVVAADACAPRHFLYRHAIDRTKDDVRLLHMLERVIAIRDDGQQTLTIRSGRKDTDGLSHAHTTRTPARICESSVVSVH